MNNVKKLLVMLLAVSMVLSMAACGPQSSSSTAPSGENPGQKTTYNVVVQSTGKRPLEGISVEVYEDDSMSNLVNVVTTNADGKASFELTVSDKYAIKLSNVPEGYKTEASYKFAGGTTTITIASALIEGKDPSGATFGLGDVMYDFEIRDVDGNTIKLSEVLAEKKVVILNLYFNQCGPCQKEMPYMNEAYGMYSDVAEVIAVNPLGGSEESEAACKSFRDSMGLNFPVCKVPTGWASMSMGGYPTTYVIDRYGVVCLAMSGTEPNLRTWTSIMEYFSSDNYVQTMVESMDQIVSKVRPTFENMDPEQIAAVLGNADGNIVYSNEAEDEYCWPFISTEYNGENVLKASNSGIEVAYALLRVDVTLKKGQALGFDYLVSSESGADLFHVIVDDTPIYRISGVDEVPTWESCYPWAAPVDGTYTVVLAYIKDDSDNVGDDTVYIKNMRILDAADIDAETYIPMEAATSADGFEFEYVDIFYNEADGYYHVGSENGPLLLANLMGATQFNEEDYIYNMALNGKFGEGMVERITPFASYAANSKLSGYCTVTKELAEILKECISMVGFEGTDTEWLKLCKYYAAYGTDGRQMEDPIAGLATFCALPAKEGMNEMPYWEGIPIMPRGKLAEFIPTRSGVYRITTHDMGKVESAFLSAWIFDENHEIIAEADNAERTYLDPNTSSVDATMLYYMEAGKSYYIDVAFWDPYTVGSIPFSITYVAPSYEEFRLCSPGPFTYDSDETGNNIYAIIHGGIDAVLNPADGYYHQDLGLDANGNQIYGSIIYADFVNPVYISHPIAGDNGLLALNAFDFGQNEDDQTVVQLLQMHNNDQEKVIEELKALWGEDMYLEKESLVDDVFNGIFHGGQGNEADVIRKYLGMLQVGGERNGCVPVTEELARVLQLLMDKYTFPGVEQSWLKMCYFYKHYGA